MRGQLKLAVAAGVLAVFASACAGELIAPAPQGLPPGAMRPDIIIDRIADDSLSADITVTPTGGVFTLGRHAIFFPAYAICDPRVSSYGLDHWDSPCEVLTEPIQIHAEIRKQDGYQWVDFTPSLRFAPTEDPNQYVWLYMKSDEAEDADVISRFAILWAPEIGAEGIDESLADSTMRTYIWRDGGILFRRIKHFTGYHVSDGRAGSAVESALVVEVTF